MCFANLVGFVSLSIVDATIRSNFSNYSLFRPHVKRAKSSLYFKFLRKYAKF